MTRAGFVAGNWKMHGNLVQNQELLAAIVLGIPSLQNASCAVCVPYPYLAQAQSVLKGTHVAWGGQNISQHHQGAYTGEVSAGMLTDFGCRYVIVGHSERRTLYGEDNQMVAEKFHSAQEQSLVPILCVGETLAQREANETEQVIARQLDAVIGLVGVNAIKQSVIAYEPVWAIGTGETATPQQAQDVHAFVRNRIAAHNSEIAADIQIVYGGSVKANNASELFAMPDIDGGLIGGASLVAAEFISICFAAQS
ncbi:triosephosphate isomerase [Nitrosomonas eutropha]|uniref:triose-phosphate isomerase n=1 Tax=Nitrosomonas TaxID=914 RepID=UPI0008818187|nr:MULTISPECIES: triose-phosphate isomerase [Nitrosomonas]MXS79234.1 triose-phosphate isomerase [Nitrosomonas sp. GH22]SCX18115.1 triosephosphate isomerase [Nitrosomonas eutropha]SDW64924.1 triosephosphate isomerase [Nitrosomonas eutropha]